jgi:uncharacterized membrane protein
MSKNRGYMQQPQEQRILHAQRFTGPLPHPDILRGFESVQPGAAERIIRMAENEAIHRQSLERGGLRAYVNNERLGMFCALIVCIIALVGGFYCILNNHPTAGTILSATPLGVIVVAFIQGRKKTQ